MTASLSGLIFLLIKALVVFGLGLYVVFAFVIVRQEQLMAHVLEEDFEPVLRMVTVIHFVSSIVVFGMALILL